MTDPIDRADFSIDTKREPNPDRIQTIQKLADKWRDARQALEHEIREAIETGHTYRQCAAAAGVSTSTIQRIAWEYE